jgi:hypothetical protein
MTEIKDSGTRSDFETGAHRDNAEGKGRMDLLPFHALMELSKIFEEGANKYRANNWRRGIPLSRFVDSGMRHMSKWMCGMRDEPHLEQAAWNFMCLIETQLLIKQGMLPESLNDLPFNPLDIQANPLELPKLTIGDEGKELDDVGKEIFSQEEVDKAWVDIKDEQEKEKVARQIRAEIEAGRVEPDCPGCDSPGDCDGCDFIVTPIEWDDVKRFQAAAIASGVPMKDFIDGVESACKTSITAKDADRVFKMMCDLTSPYVPEERLL